jgi:hypothetical protein
MFIHWDHASSQGIEIGWPITGRSIIPLREKSEDSVTVDQYHSSAKDFNPTNWNAEAVAEMAKQAGATYVVFTSRHHGGYSMFHSEYSDFSIQHSPFKRIGTMKIIQNSSIAIGLIQKSIFLRQIGQRMMDYRLRRIGIVDLHLKLGRGISNMLGDSLKSCFQIMVK